MATNFKPTHTLAGKNVALLDNDVNTGISIGIKYETKPEQIAYTLPKNLTPIDRTGVELSEFFLSVTDNGKYAIFNNGILSDIIQIENYDIDGKQYRYDTPIISRLGSNEPLSSKEYIATLHANNKYRIILANQIML